MAHKSNFLPVYRSRVVAVGPEHHTQVTTEALAVAWLKWRESVRLKRQRRKPLIPPASAARQGDYVK
jgi:hypothetical protein